VTVTQALLGGAILLAAVLAIFGGSPLTGWVFAHVERRSGGSPTQPVTGIHAAACRAPGVDRPSASWNARRCSSGCSPAGRKRWSG
jgi:hypothetical protein